ncbi:MAG: class I SAM-dependent methyltransferase [Acidobacteriota bacterium]
MFGPRHEHRIGFILRETKEIRPGGRLLEAAVGLGQMARRLSAQGHHVFGIDGSIEAARFVRRNTPVPVVVGDITRLPFRDQSFRLVTSGETLEHIDDDAAAANEIARVMEMEGTCVITVPAMELLRNPSDTYYEHLRRYSKSGLTKLFQNAGVHVARASFWGFPAVLVYDFLFILPLNFRRRRVSSESDAALRSVARAGRSSILIRTVLAVFSLDRLFSWIPFGPGLVLVGKRHEGQLGR